jgi:hypothetical protein
LCQHGLAAERDRTVPTGHAAPPRRLRNSHFEIACTTASRYRAAGYTALHGSMVRAESIVGTSSSR